MPHTAHDAIEALDPNNLPAQMLLMNYQLAELRKAHDAAQAEYKKSISDLSGRMDKMESIANRGLGVLLALALIATGTVSAWNKVLEMFK